MEAPEQFTEQSTEEETLHLLPRYRFDDSLDEKGKKKHLHSLDGKPLIGTTTALKVIAKPLTWWASGLAVSVFGWLKKLDTRKSTKEEVAKNAVERLARAEEYLKQIAALSPADYLKLLDKGYAAHANNLDKSADKGTDMHKELEDYVKACIKENNGNPDYRAKPDFEEFEQVKILRDWAVKNVKRFIAAEGHGYSEKLWVGCIFDVLYEDMEGRLVILDHKSSKEAYMSQFLQCAGNDIQIAENGVLDKEGKLIYALERPVEYYAIFPFGMEKPEPQFYYDTESAKEGFKAALTLNKIINQ